MFPTEKHKRLEDFWRLRLKDARAQYDLAAGLCKMAGTEFTDGTLPTPDGGANLFSALSAEGAARDEYMRVLRIFADLVLRGKRPEG